VRQVLLLRGINLGPSRRLAMPQLRDSLGEAGYEDVGTYVQSGNVVLRSDSEPEQLATDVSALIAARFGLEVPVVARTRDELAAVVALNPLRDVVTEPKRYQVSFLAGELDAGVVERLHGLLADGEAMHIDSREVYAWHEAGVARSKLWNMLAGKSLGVVATARNWITVETLFDMASEED
jgi:uncharacterized protein (DUF1697 family)